MQGLQRDDIHGGTYKRRRLQIKDIGRNHGLALVSGIYDSDQN